MQLWTKVTHRGPSQAWPRDRDWHSAVSLSDPASNPAHPCLLIAFGYNHRYQTLHDAWVWSWQRQEWEEVGLWSKYLVRFPSLQQFSGQMCVCVFVCVRACVHCEEGIIGGGRELVRPNAGQTNQPCPRHHAHI